MAEDGVPQRRALSPTRRAVRVERSRDTPSATRVSTSLDTNGEDSADLTHAAPRPLILIPIKPFGEGKSRLAGVLAPAARRALVRHLFGHVLGVARRLDDRADCAVLSGSAEALAMAETAGARAIREQRPGHNVALEDALAAIAGEAPRPMLILSADLPLVDAADLRAMLDAGRDAPIVIAPDQDGTGTNALLLPTPRAIAPAFGPGSRAAHEVAATHAGLRYAIIPRPGLALDIDAPADLAELPRHYNPFG